jgi:hypothetical protein
VCAVGKSIRSWKSLGYVSLAEIQYAIYGLFVVGRFIIVYERS